MLMVRPGAEDSTFPPGRVAIVCNSVQTELRRTGCQLHTFALMPKTSAISVRVSDQVKAAAEKAAADDHRSLASLMEKLLTEHLKAKGYLER
jgi:hypothetical protein